MASADLTAVVVAAVGVAGTMGAPLLTQWSRRQEFADAAEREEQRLRQERDERDLQHKRDVYAALNSSARAYRTAAYDFVLALKRGEDPDGSTLDAVRSSYRDQYAQAQMVLPGRALRVASEVNRCLALGYRLVKLLPGRANRQEAWTQAEAWFNKPLAEAVWLLRHALREDLGVIDEFPDLIEHRAQLKAVRRRVEGELDTEQNRPVSDRP
ncbi:hypothetical protein ACWGJW_39500 [Streptomyces nigrescens]